MSTKPKTFDKASILRAAISIGRERSVHGVCKRHVAERLGCSMGTVNYHWGTMDALRNAVQTALKAKRRK